MIGRLGLSGSLVVLAALLPACGAFDDDANDSSAEAEFVSGKKLVVGTTSFSGTFAFDVDGTNVKMAFDVSRVDWAAGTAVFDSRILEGANSGVTEDRGIPLLFETLDSAEYPCTGCYKFRAEVNGDTVLEMYFKNNLFNELYYSGYPATNLKITKTKKEPLAPIVEEEGDVREGVGEKCGGFAGARCLPGLRCDNSLGINTGYCRD